MAASMVELGRYFKVLIMTKYVEARVLKEAVSPNNVGTWPAAMLIADPVIKAEIAVRGMKSTIHPHRINPMKQTIEPAIIAKAEAMTGPGTSGWVACTWRMTFPVRVDMTATGYRQKS